MEIPAYGGPKVTPSPLPSARVQDTAPAAAFGVPANVDLSGVAQVAAQIANEAKARADQVAVSAADAQLVRAKTAALWDPKQGAMNARGKNAIPASDAATEGFHQAADAIGSGLANDRQKEAFRERVAMHGADLGAALQQHVSTQLRQYDDDTTQGHVDALAEAANASYQDDHTVQSSIDSTRALLIDYFRRNGHGDGAGVDDFAQAQIANKVSSIRAGVFEQLSNDGQDLAAAKYFTDHRGEFVGRDLVTAERVADAGSTRAAGMQAATDIIQTNTTLAGAMKAVDAISDIKVHDDAQERVVRHFQIEAAAREQEKQAAYDQARAIVTDTGDFDQIPLSTVKLLSDPQVAGLKRSATDIAFPKRRTDENTKSYLYNLSALPGSRGHFLEMDLSLYEGKLSTADYDAIVKYQRDQRVGDLKTADARAHAEVVHDERTAESDTKKAGTAAASEHRAALNKAWTAYDKAKKAYDADVADAATMRQPVRTPRPVPPSEPRPGMDSTGKVIPLPSKTPAVVPGAPIRRPMVGPPIGPPGAAKKPPTTSLVPQSWIDHAASAPDYAAYLAHMGVDVG